MVKKIKFSCCHIMFCFNKIKSNQAKDDIWEPLATEETVSTRPLHHSRVHSVQLFCVCSFGLAYFVELETLFKFKLKLWLQNDFISYGWQKWGLLLLCFSPLAQLAACIFYIYWQRIFTKLISDLAVLGHNEVVLLLLLSTSKACPDGCQYLWCQPWTCWGRLCRCLIGI